jgi:hypothetical protein
MPLTDFEIGASIAWTFTLAQSPFQQRTQGPDQTLTFQGNAVNLGIWNNVLASTFTLAPSSSMTIDLGAQFTNLNGEVVTPAKALGLYLSPTGGDVTIAPGPTNPFDWFFNNASGNATNGLKAFNNGVLLNFGDGADTTGTTIGSGSRCLVLNNASGSATVTGAYGFLLG